MSARERIVIEDDEYGRLLVEREPAPELTVWRASGQTCEAAGDEPIEYIPPTHQRAA